MTAAVVDLAAWLTAVWDEEERLARDCIAEVGDHRAGDPFEDGSGTATYDDFPSYGWGSGERELAYMAGPAQPTAVLARIAAGRKILELHSRLSDYCNTCGGQWPCLTLRLLASPYKGREGWQEEWDE